MYPNVCQLSEMIRSELEQTLYTMSENESQKHMIQLCKPLVSKDIQQCYQLKKIVTYENYLDIQEYMNVCISIYNSLNETEYHFTKKTIQELFSIFNKMSFSYIL